MKQPLQLRTERLLIRPINIDDAEEVYQYRSDAITNKYQGWIPSTVSDVQEFIKTRVSSTLDIYDTWFQLVIIEKNSNELIGDIGLHFLDEEKFQVEIGFTLAKRKQGTGMATEAIKELIRFLFENLNKRRIIGSIDPRNIKSIALVERIGFRKEAHFKESVLQNGEWFDDVVYALLKSEWLDKNLQKFG